MYCIKLDYSRFIAKKHENYGLCFSSSFSFEGLILDMAFKSLSKSSLRTFKSKVNSIDLIFASCPSTTIFLLTFFAIFILQSFAKVNQIFENRYDAWC